MGSAGVFLGEWGEGRQLKRVSSSVSITTIDTRCSSNLPARYPCSRRVDGHKQTEYEIALGLIAFTVVTVVTAVTVFTLVYSSDLITEARSRVMPGTPDSSSSLACRIPL